MTISFPLAALTAFVFGTIAGSFINAAVYRTRHKKQIAGRARSICPKCKQPLRWFELIPLLSFFLQLGRCRRCHKPISWQYPLVELAAGLLFVLLVNHFFLPCRLNSVLCAVDLGVGTLIISGLVFLFTYDLRYQLLPDAVVLPGYPLAVFYALFNAINAGSPAVFTQSLIGGAVAFLFFYSLVLLSKGTWMGGGDVKLAGVFGLLLGYQVWLALFLAFFIGSVVSLGLIARGKKNMKSAIAFGPFMIVGYLVVFFFYQPLLGTYNALLTQFVTALLQ